MNSKCEISVLTRQLYLLLDPLGLEGAADPDVNVAPGAEEVVRGGVVLLERPPRPNESLVVEVQLLVAEARRADALARTRLGVDSIENFSMSFRLRKSPKMHMSLNQNSKFTL